MRWVDGQGIVQDRGFFLRRLGDSRIFPVIGNSGSPLLQPGSSLDMNGIGTCFVDNSAVGFRVRTVSGDVSWNCDGEWSVLKKRQGNYSTIYEQDSSVWKLGLEDTIRQNYPNANGDEFWLFPTQRTDVLKTVVGNGGRPVSYAVYGSVSDNTPGAPTTRGIYALDVRSFEVTVIIHSNSLKTARALDNNFLWDWNGSNSRNVFVAWYENLIDGTANLYPLAFKGSIDGPGSSSQLYGSAVVLGLRRNFSEPTAVAVMPPIFRVHDNDSMFATSYYESSLLKVETVYQFAA